MEIKEFVEKYNNETDEDKKEQMIKDRIKTYYMPYCQKVAFVEKVIKSTCYKNKSFVLDSPILSYIFITKAIEYYTDLKFEDDKDFDRLEQYGINQKFIDNIGTDYYCLKSVLDMDLSDIEKVNNNIVKLFTDAFSLFDEQMNDLLRKLSDQNGKQNTN